MFEDTITAHLQNGADIDFNIHTTVHRKELLHLIAEDEWDVHVHIIQSELSKPRFICIIGDGSNDKGVIEQEVVHARLVKNGKPKIALGTIVNGMLNLFSKESRTLCLCIYERRILHTRYKSKGGVSKF